MKYVQCREQKKEYAQKSQKSCCLENILSCIVLVSYNAVIYDA